MSGFAPETGKCLLLHRNILLMFILYKERCCNKAKQNFNDNDFIEQMHKIKLLNYYLHYQRMLKSPLQGPWDDFRPHEGFLTQKHF